MSPDRNGEGPWLRDRPRGTMKLIPHHQDGEHSRREYRSPDGAWRVVRLPAPPERTAALGGSRTPRGPRRRLALPCLLRASARRVGLPGHHGRGGGGRERYGQEGRRSVVGEEAPGGLLGRELGEEVTCPFGLTARPARGLAASRRVPDEQVVDMAAADGSTVHRLVELLKLERDRPPEFQDGGAAVRAWARRVRELEGLLWRVQADENRPSGRAFRA